ncbi:MAG TPA: MaoC family dehydratase [Micropepsaceae bacterium]|jgi:3-hydroxybutyryl-CoA dehydratase|nr:MaoC family dehydratase [Micropepsaceae bacterium]
MSAANVVSHYIEDLTIGQSASYERTVSADDIQKFGEVSGDFNPLHFDDEYAKGTIFRGRIAHGMLSLSYLSTVLGTKLPGAGSIFMSATTRFKAPVRIGDTVKAVCTVREIDVAKKRVTFDCLCKVGDIVVVEGEALVRVPSREH